MDKRDVPTLLKGFRRSLGPPSASRPGDRAEVRADRDLVPVSEAGPRYPVLRGVSIRRTSPMVLCPWPGLTSRGC